MTESLYPKYFDGNASLEETQRACKVEQQDNFSVLKKIEMGTLTKDDGNKSPVNVCTFNHVGLFRLDEILNDLLFIDVSTPSGVADATAAQGTHTPMFDCKMFVKKDKKDVSVFGKKRP